MSAALRFEQVSKSFGRTQALAQLSFEVPEGSICGLVGPNGAGKTTAMGVTAGLVRPDSGTVDVLGQGPFRIETHAGRVSIMPQDSVPTSHTPLRELLTFYGALSGLSEPAAGEEAARVLELVSLQDRAGALFPSLSHGMRRRFSVAQALIGQPELVILDEPTSGLDPELVAQLRDTIISLRGTCTVLVSSHVLSELESMCDHIVMIDSGKSLRQGALGSLATGEISLSFGLSRKPDLERLERAIEADLSGCRLTWKEPRLEVRAPDSYAVEALSAACLRELLDAGIGVRDFRSGESLEAAYLRARQER